MRKYFIQGLPFVIALAITLTATAQGKVGINTTTPAAMLHVMDSSVVFTGPNTIPAPGNPPVSGMGTRFMWYPQKAALRAGGVSTTLWNKEYVGNYSIAMGYNALAQGDYSISFGYSNWATGQYSVAMGTQTVASGLYSTSFGYDNNASGESSTAMGESTYAPGNYSTTMGYNTFASGESSTAMGSATIASGLSSLSSGYFTKASGPNSFAAGYFTNSSGNASIAMGNLSRSPGQFSFAMGTNTVSRSYASLVIGGFNDTTNMSSLTTWVATDPLFAIGVGSVSARRNAITTLKNGRTGFNTINPKAVLHVADSTVLFSGPADLSGPETATPISTSGSYLMWYPDKAAFRCGYVIHPFWHKDSIGDYSIALGYSPKAKGERSTALGYLAKALGDYSAALGSGTASGDFSIAIGNGTQAKNLYAFALGHNAIASGYNSMTLGHQTEASGSYALAMGNLTEARGTNAISMGENTLASGQASTSTGLDTKASGKASASFGFSTISKSYASLTLGRYNDTTTMLNPLSWVASDPVFVIGNGTSTTYHNAFTVLKDGRTGINTHTPDRMLHVVRNGESNGFLNTNAMAIFESDLDAYIQFSQTNTRKSGILSGNESNIRSAIYFNADSTMEFRTGGDNLRLKLSNDGSIGIGTANPSHPLHIVSTDDASGGFDDGILIENTNTSSTGEAALLFRNRGSNGTGNKYWITGLDQSRNYSWAYGASFVSTNYKMLLDSLGRLGVGTVSPDALLHVWKGTGGNLYSTSAAFILEDDNDHYIQFSNLNNDHCGIISGNEDDDIRSSILFLADSSMIFRTGGSNTRLSIENDGNVGIGTTTPDYLLEVNGTVAKPGGGLWTSSSDRRLKQNIQPFTDGLESMLKINPITYHYNEFSGYDTDPEYVGVIAQELKEVAPYMVSTSNKKTADGVNDYLSVDNSAMTYMLINAVKEQQVLIENQQQRINLLEQRLLSLEKE